MKKLNFKLVLTAAVAAALVAGCGGGGSSGEPAPDIAQSVAAALDFIKNVIAGTSDDTEPVSLTGIVLATDDAAEPVALAP